MGGFAATLDLFHKNVQEIIDDKRHVLDAGMDRASYEYKLSGDFMKFRICK